MVVIDTDVLLVEFAFQRDPRAQANHKFLSLVQRREANPATTIYNLMELLGQLSFNLSPAKLDAWPEWLQRAYGLSILWPDTVEASSPEAFFRAEIFARPLEKMRVQRMSFLDSLILGLAEASTEVQALVTWNARHFKHKTTLPVLTPEEYLQS